MERTITIKPRPRKINLNPRDIFSLSPLFEGEVIQDSSGAHPPGASIAIGHGLVNSKKFPSIIFPALNPVEFYLFSATSSLDAIKKLEEDVKIDSKTINALLLNEIQFCIFAISALEAFVNQIIPGDYVHKKEGSLKSEIELKWSLIDKIKEIIPEITGVFVASNSVRWSKLTNLIGLRNDLVHLKTTTGPSDFLSYQDLYIRLLENDYADSFTVLTEVIRMISNPIK